MPIGKLTRQERIAKYSPSRRLNEPQARYRERDLRVAKTGSYKLSSNPPVFSTAYDGVTEECTDTIYNWRKVNTFSLFKKESVYPVLNGYRLNVSLQVIRSFSDFPIGYRPGVVDPRTVFPALLPTEISDLAWMAMARTNPNAPLVGVPSFLGELKDFFKLIRGRGEGLIRQAAQGYIAWRWVLRPLWSDLQKLLRFQRVVNQRAQMLHNLQCGKEIRKRVKLRERYIKGSSSSVTLHSQGAVINGSTRLDSYERVWGTATWKIAGSTSLPQLGYLESRRFQEHLAAGIAQPLSSDLLATAWELCPWSWLIDWCTCYDDIIAATRNAIPVTWSNVAIMRETIVERKFPTIGTDPTWTELSMSGNYVEKGTRKERFRPLLLPFSLPCFLPLIEGGHWQILASLALASGRLPGLK